MDQGIELCVLRIVRAVRMMDLGALMYCYGARSDLMSTGSIVSAIAGPVYLGAVDVKSEA